jgi:hypothetical protein
MIKGIRQHTSAYVRQHTPAYVRIPRVQIGRVRVSPPDEGLVDQLRRQYLYFCTSKASKLSTCAGTTEANVDTMKQ